MTPDGAAPPPEASAPTGRRRVLVAMSGGVDSSVAAALLVAAGHEVVGATLRLWGGAADSGCCSVADVDDARRVADALGIAHHVFNFGADFDRDVVAPYVEAHARGRTPNPCIACNRHVKFDRLARRAASLGFDALATGHHARLVTRADGSVRLRRGADPAKDQSYVLYMLGQDVLSRLVLPVGELTKAQVRAEAARLGLRTATKPDSQDVCFIHSGQGRAAFLAERLELRPGRAVDAAGREVGTVQAVQLVTIGQRRGLGLGGGAGRRFVTAVDVDAGTVTVGGPADLVAAAIELEDLCWAAAPHAGPVLAQVSAHGPARPGRLEGSRLVWDELQRRVAPGQAVVLYDGEEVVGGGTATDRS